MRNVLILAAACMPAVASWAGELPCTLTKADYVILADTESKATPESVKKMSADDQEMLCSSRAYINLVQKKKGDIDQKEIADYDPQFLTKAEQDMLHRAAEKAIAAIVRPIADACRKDPRAAACHVGDAGKDTPKKP